MADSAAVSGTTTKNVITIRTNSRKTQTKQVRPTETTATIVASQVTTGRFDDITYYTA